MNRFRIGQLVRVPLVPVPGIVKFIYGPQMLIGFEGARFEAWYRFSEVEAISPLEQLAWAAK